MSNKVKTTPIAIIGMGCMFPRARDRECFWINIKDGIDAVTEIPETHWKISDYYDPDPKKPDHTHARRGGFLMPVEFDPMAYGIAPNALEATDTSQLLSLMVARQALEDAGYAGGDGMPRDRVSVILGVTGAQELVMPLGSRLSFPVWKKALEDMGLDRATVDAAVSRISDGFVGWQESSFPGLLGNVVAGRIANRFDFGGTNCVVDAACAGSLSAIHMACLELQAGISDVALTGGVDAFNDIFMYMCFSKTHALSASGDAKPFDADGDGTILGEGIGILTLKRLDDAVKAGDRIYAVLKGMGASSDGKGQAIYAPSVEGQKKALEKAYALAGFSPATVSLVEAHGTGTKVGDNIELMALSDVYQAHGAASSRCALGAVKSQIGHTKSAAGVAGIIKVAMGLHHHILPPTIKVNRPLPLLEPGKSPFYLNTKKRPWLNRDNVPRRGVVSSLGFGGSNFHCVLEEYSGKTLPVPDWTGQVQILAFSAESKDALAETIKTWPVPDTFEAARYAAAELRESFDTKAPHRALIVTHRVDCETETDIENQVGMALKMLTNGQDKPFPSSPKGVYIGHGSTGVKLAVVFTGQGSQYPDMLLDLACQFPMFQTVLENANARFEASSSDSSYLTDYIYPPAVFTDAETKQQFDNLKETRVAQPAIGAVSLGAFEVLTHFGVSPDAAAGHSYGEITALCAAGAIDRPTFHKLSALRGQLMGAGEGDKGSMAAVMAPLSTIQEVIKAEKLNLVIANKNAPEQGVISGDTEEIKRGLAAFKSRNIRAVQLSVSAAFHSPLVAAASKPLKDAMKKMTFKKPDFPVYSNTTACPYPEDEREKQLILAHQLEEPVEFMEEIKNMVEAGVGTFIEVGPGNRMMGLIRQIARDKECYTMAVDGSMGKKSGEMDLARVLAQLAALGYAVDLNKWDPIDISSKKPPAKSIMSVTLTGANYVNPKKKKLAAPVVSPGSLSLPGAGTKPLSGVFAQPRSEESMDDSIKQAFSLVQENLKALQQIQEQTADLHRKFLENQELAQKNFQTLLGQQQIIMGGSAVPVVSTVPVQPVPAAAMSATVVPAVPVSPAPVSAVPDTGFQQTLLDVVAEKTGYPVDILTLEMELDADLGIDSIKRVEILSAMGEKYPDIPAVEPDAMGTLRTLGDIVNAMGASMVSSTSGPVPTVPVSEPTDTGFQQTLLEVVAEKTGYPMDILTLEMELDADLGIDSIKRVEILSAMGEKYPDIPAVEPDAMGTLRTLGDIVDAMSATVTAPGPVPAATSVTAPSPAAESGFTPETLMTIIAEKTGYPEDVLTLEMELDADLGIDSIKRVEIMSAIQERCPGIHAPGPDELSTVRTLNDIMEMMGSTPSTVVENAPVPVPPAEKPVPHTSPDPVVPEQETGGIEKQFLKLELLEEKDRKNIELPGYSEILVTYDDTGLGEAIIEASEAMGVPGRLVPMDYVEHFEPPDNLAGLIIVAPKNGCDGEFLKNAFVLIQKTGNRLRSAGRTETPVVASVSRMDGAFGLSGVPGDYVPENGGLAGLVKTVAQEWPEVHCRCIDIDGSAEGLPDPEMILKEIIKTGPVEVGFRDGKVVTPVLEPAPLPDVNPDMLPLKPGDPVVISGGARGVTAEVAVAFASACRPELHLLGRSPAPGVEPEFCRDCRDEASIKAAIVSHSTGKISPKKIQKQCRAILQDREIQANIQRMEAAGSSVIYHSVDVLDADGVAAVLETVSGPIRGLVHGAGVLADKFIEDKKPADFTRVYDTKVIGLNNLLNGLKPEELKVMVLFSSSTARIGRKGQIDYAVANEVLNKIAQKQALILPDCRVISVNWGPWDGGMVTSGIRKIFQEEGIAVIPLKKGAAYLVNELSTAPSGDEGLPVEIVILGTESDGAPAETPVTGPSTEPDEKYSLAIEQNIGLDTHPVLDSHRLDGKPVVPMALLMEWSAHAAVHLNPGLNFAGFDDFRLLKGIILEETGSYPLRFYTGTAVKEKKLFRVPVEIRGGVDREYYHVRCQVILTGKLPKAKPVLGGFKVPDQNTLTGESVYQDILFHESTMQNIESVTGISGNGIEAQVRPSPPPSEWVKDPLRKAWLTEPLIMDACFQLMIVWCDDQADAASLPCYVGKYRQYTVDFPDSTGIIIRVNGQRGNQVYSDVEIRSGSGVLATMEDYECITDKNLAGQFGKEDS